MKKLKVILLSTVFLLIMSSSALAVNLTATAHVQNIGDMSATSGSTIRIGTEGQSLRMEAFTLKTDNPNLSVVYSGHVENIGWQDEVRNGATAGTKGESKRIEAFRIRLEGADAGKYDIYYRAHVQNYGTLDWAKNGEMAGTQQHAYRCESLEITIKDKDAKAPGETEMPMIWANDSEEGRNLALVNAYRQSKGLHLLTGDPLFHQVGEARVQELVTKYSHDRVNGEGPNDMVVRAYPDVFLPWVAFGENIALDGGGGSPEEFYNIWYHSDLHRYQMENKDYRVFTYNQTRNPGTNYALEWFTTPGIYQKNMEQSAVDMLMDAWWEYHK